MTTGKLTDDQWREKLTPDQYRILRQAGTEAPFSGELVGNKSPGTYVCAGCGKRLFASDTKYDSSSGWPSFTAPASADSVVEQSDDSLGMRRVEVRCAECHGHLGHVFPDGPGPTGLRYCINSAALDFAGTDGASDDAADESEGHRG